MSERSERGEDDRDAEGLDRLVDGAMRALTTLARRGSTLTIGVAAIALLVVGLAFLVGLAALGGTAEKLWIVVGGVLLVTAVGAPLLASRRLRAIPAGASALAGELRSLLHRSDDAKRVVVETVATDESGGSTGPADERRLPGLIYQSQHFTRLGSIAGMSGEFTNLAATFRRVATLPGLIAIGLVLTGLGAFLGFVLTLVWIF